MKTKFLPVASVLLILSSTAFAQDSDKESDAVKQVVRAYLSGTNSEAKRRALYAEAKIFSVAGRNGRVVETAVSRPAKPMPPGATTVEPSQRIVAVDVAQDGAMVKVESTFPPDMPGGAAGNHIQYLSLLKLNGEWKIVSILMPPVKRAEAASK